MDVCPYLGKIGDQSTPVLFPSHLNGCHRSSTAFTPDFDHQDRYCLTKVYCQCAAFIDVTQALEVPTPKNERRHAWTFILVITLMVLAGALFSTYQNEISGFYAQLINPQQIPVTSTQKQSTVTNIATKAVALTYSPTLTITRIPTPLNMATSTTSQLAALVNLEMPFGSQAKFVIHRVRAGESFSEITSKYKTTIEAIKWVNFNLNIPLWENSLLVIPIDMDGIDPDLPPFEAYQVKGGAIPVKDLALTLKVDAFQLSLYNGFSSDQILLNGHWLIIPRTRK